MKDKLASAGRIALIAFGVVFLTGAAGPVTCSQFQSAFTADVVALETKVAALVAKIRAAAPVVLADIQTGIQAACTVVPIANSSVASVSGAIANPSPKVQNYLALAATYGAKAQAACTQYNATQAQNPTVSGGANTVLAIWNAYQAAKQNLTAAQQATPSGS